MKKKSSITGALIGLIIGIVVIILFSDSSKSEYQPYVGRKVVIDHDTLTIVNFDAWNNKFTLSNNLGIDPDYGLESLVDSTKIKKVEETLDFSWSNYKKMKVRITSEDGNENGVQLVSFPKENVAIDDSIIIANDYLVGEELYAIIYLNNDQLYITHLAKHKDELPETLFMTDNKEIALIFKITKWVFPLCIVLIFVAYFTNRTSFF